MWKVSKFSRVQIMYVVVYIIDLHGDPLQVCSVSLYSFKPLHWSSGSFFFFGLGWGGGGSVEKKIRKATISFVVFVGPSARNNSAPTGRIFMNFDICLFCYESLQEIQVSLKSDKNNGSFYDIFWSVSLKLISAVLTEFDFNFCSRFVP